MSAVRTRLLFALPLVLIGALILIGWIGLKHNPSRVPSPLIGKPAPVFSLPRLGHPALRLTERVFRGRPTLFNVWASWCVTCVAEHRVLMSLAAHGVRIIGLDYQDHRRAALAFLRRYGDPYRAIAYDPRGVSAMNWGVYGTPETFVLGPHGVIRGKIIGPLTRRVVRRRLLPLLRRLSSPRARA
ncbi:MAG: DsbE family thiol:disulfide interchange protein [Gammaproteobacteria bacterium]|nr:DsbE family thiol:disulfide interchange protein [Gammaproteobacteria bacterium]